MVDPISAINTRVLIGSDATESKRVRESEKSTTSTGSGSVQASMGQLLSISAERKEVSIELSIGSGPEELRMAASTVMERVSTVLQQKFGLTSEEFSEGTEGLSDEASAQELVDYFSPSKTAQRILNFSTGFFSAYQKNHEGDAEDKQVTEFTSLIRDAIQKGFEQAEEELGGSFDDLGEIGENIKETFQLVMDGLNEYREEKLKLMGNPTQEVTDAALPDVDDLVEPPQEAVKNNSGTLDITA